MLKKYSLEGNVMIEPSKVKEAFREVERENYSFRAYLKNHADTGAEYIYVKEGFYDIRKSAAHLYHKYGRDDKYVSYLETHLGKKSETYVALINYYKEHDNFDGACRVAEQALEKCKDDLTDSFIYLLVDAEKREDKDKYKKLYSSAKRRRLADINRIDQALSDLKSGSYTCLTSKRRNLM